MQQRALVFIKPQTTDNFLSVYMAGSLPIVELDCWETLLWFHHGMAFFGSNDNFIASNDDRTNNQPDEIA